MKCQKAKKLLSEYINNALSARDTWEVDRHLASCGDCARLADELRRTVQAVAAAPRYEVSDHFMANLQARLAQVEPRPARRVWADSLRAAFRPRLLPAWAAAGAACALMVAVLARGPMTPPVTGVAEPFATEVSIVQAARNQHMALSATNPLEDVSAANLDSTSSADYGSDRESAH